MGSQRPVRNGVVWLAFKEPVWKGVDELVYDAANRWAVWKNAEAPQVLDAIKWKTVLLVNWGFIGKNNWTIRAYSSLSSHDLETDTYKYPGAQRCTMYCRVLFVFNRSLISCFFCLKELLVVCQRTRTLWIHSAMNLNTTKHTYISPVRGANAVRHSSKIIDAVPVP